MDFVSMVPDPGLDPAVRSLFARVVEAHNAALAAEHMFDLAYGRRVAGDLAHAGLADVGCEGRAAMWRGGEAGGTVWRLTLTQLREAMLATGLVTTADIDAAIALCADPRFSFLSQVTMAAWGRRPRAS
jgi:hypothetical protein